MKKVAGWILVILCVVWVILLASGGKESFVNKSVLVGQGVIFVFIGLVGIYLTGVTKRDE